MSHIPPDKLLPQDMVDMHDHGPPDKPHPHRWTLAGDKPPKPHVKSGKPGRHG